MSAKFHVNGAGETGKCSAQEGNCPFGGSDQHHDTPEKARAAYEESQSDANLLAGLKKSKDFVAVSPVPKEQLMSTDHVAHDVGPYRVSTRSIPSIPARGDTPELILETAVFKRDEFYTEPHQVWVTRNENGKYSEDERTTQHQVAIEYAVQNS